MNFWQKFIRSIGSPEQIKEAYKESVGRAFKYLVLMFTMLFILVALPTTIKAVQSISLLQSEFAEKAPDFKLANGTFEFYGQQPYIQEENNQAIIIDTTGKTSEAALDNYDQGILVTKDKMIQKQPGKTSIINFSDLKGIEIDKAKVQSWIPFMNLFIFILIFILYIFYLVRKIIGILLFALLIYFVPRFRELFDYSKGVKIAIYASTLGTLLQAIKELVFSNIPYISLYFWVIYMMATTIYIVVGIRAVEKSENNLIE